MKKIFCLFCLICTGSAFSQKLAPINSVEIYNNARDLAGKEKYDEAFEEIIKIDRNDTNYVAALLEKSVILIDLKKYDEAILTCKEGIALNDAYVHDFYLNFGSSLSNLKKYDEALSTYDEAIKVFPRSYAFEFNKGITYQLMGKYPEAVVQFKKALRLNPFHPGSHLSLGILASEEGLISQAVCCFDMFLILEPNTSRSFAVLKRLNEIVSSKYDHTPKNIKLSPEGGDDFSDVDLILTNYAALDKKFKTPSKFELPLIKQSYALFTKVEYDKNDKGFWMQTYIPLFKAIIAQDKFQDFSGMVLQSSQNEEHMAFVKKHASEITAFDEWQYNFIAKAALPIPVKYQDKTLNLQPHFDSDIRRIECLGNRNEKNLYTGYCEFYFNTGKLSSNGVFDEQGKKDGLWQAYYRTGAVNRKVNYLKDSLDGDLISYYQDGTLKHERHFVNGKLQGPEKFYNQAGFITKNQKVTNDMLDGPFFYYYDQGEKYKQYSGIYNKGELNDTVFEYFDGGGIKVAKNLRHDMLEGNFTTYYRSGKIYSQINYSKGMREGEFKSYFENGKVESTATFKGDYQVGHCQTFNSDGVLTEEYDTDDRGRRNGLFKDYDNGKPWLELEYSKGEIVGYKFFQKNGEILKADHKRKGTFDFIGYYPEGSKHQEGTYTVDGKTGIWKYYDLLGNLSDEESYNDKGELDGKQKSYFVGGQLREESVYKAGRREGYAATYYVNNQVEKEGWYINGQEEGYWNTYYNNGTPSERKYYSRGEQRGYQLVYAPNGKMTREEFYKDGLFSRLTCFDSTGVENEVVDFKNGTGPYQLHFNNKTMAVSGYSSYGVLHGDFKWFNYAGKLAKAGTYLRGNKNGTWTSYDEDGKVASVGNYYFGQIDGKWSYYKKGKLTQTEVYEKGKLEGEVIWYYENGTISVKKKYHLGEEEGEAISYDPSGELQIQRNYKNGKLLSYTYYDKTGKLVPPIDVTSGTFKAIAFFKNGNKSREFEFVKGNYTGKSMVYFANGKPQESRTYKDDEMDGSLITYYADGKVKEDEPYVNGVLNGVTKEYAPDGKLVKEMTYVMGQLHGPAHYYNATGKLIKTRLYYDDEILHETSF